MTNVPEDRLANPAFSVSLIEKNAQHFYCINDGPELPGVTGILSVISKPALIPWAKNQALAVVESHLFGPLKGSAVGQISISTEWWETVQTEAKKRSDKIKDDAADVGTRAHAWIDAKIKGQPLPRLTDDIRPACDNFLRFWQKQGLRFVAGDTKVGSPLHGYGGSLDWLAVDPKGQLILGDVKTSNGIWPEYGVQLGGYSQALYERFMLRAKKGLIIRVGKEDAEYEIGWVNDLAAAEQAFLAAKTLKTTLAQKDFVIKEKENGKGKRVGEAAGSTAKGARAD